MICGKCGKEIHPKELVIFLPNAWAHKNCPVVTDDGVRSNDLIAEGEHLASPQASPKGNQGVESEASTRAIAAEGELLCLPKPDNVSRVESGPLQFGDDWPGYFMRGDDAAMTAYWISLAVDCIQAMDPIAATNLNSIAERLRSCRV